jgi:large conductance mechanosensitive channel
MGLVKEFRTFLLRGNIVDLAVAVVIGVAFGAVVTSLVQDLITPVIAAIVGRPDVSDITFTINDSTFRIGLFINAVISFMLIAAAVFFLVVKPVNMLYARYRPADTSTRECPYCATPIPSKATRCAHCTSQVTPTLT